MFHVAYGAFGMEERESLGGKGTLPATNNANTWRLKLIKMTRQPRNRGMITEESQCSTCDGGSDKNAEH